MCHLDDDEVAQALLRYVSYTLQERAVETYDGTYTQGRHLTLSRDVMCLCRLSRLLTPHVVNEFRLIADTWQRMLSCRF